MSGGSTIVDLRVSDVDFAAPSGAEPVNDDYARVVGEPEIPLELDEYQVPSRIAVKVWGAILTLLALGWIGFFGYFVAPIFLALPNPMTVNVSSTIGLITMPLILLGVAWLIVQRSSKAEARRFNATALSMRVEAGHLQAVIAAMTSTIEANRLALGDQITSMMAAASGMAEQIANAQEHAAGLDAAARTAESKLNVLLATLPKAHADTEALASKIESTGLTASGRAAALDAQIVALAERGKEADALTSGAAERLAANIARMEATSETAGARLESVTAVMSETVDGLLDRTANAMDEARKGITAQGDAMTAMLSAHQATLDRTATDSTTALAERIAAIEAVVNHVAEVLNNGQAQVDALTRSIQDSRDSAERFAGEAAPQLLESLMRIRDTANTAADHARDAIERIVPEAGATIEAAGKEALEKSLAAVAEAQAAAAASAAKASDKLNEQMRAIADASAHIEARLADTSEADGFARRVSLLIESLQSAAIDLSAIYAAEVPDKSWAAYLRGDRGAFSRRAVKLIGPAELRSIAQVYEHDYTAREHINRYIHDFEAMLRAVLAQRDSAPIGVTLLSSDMGKLYVALAQAIERLRA
ncbi:MAG: hypothetical protein JSR79_04230 [Proteobacteria bacterium]|nr:hypothetical protein [Pseudomonadota bacterium]